MAYRALYNSKISDARGRGLILAIDGELERLWDAVEGSVGHKWGSSVELTIASGVVAVQSEKFHYTIDTEGDAASDSLDKITGLAEGDEVLIRPASGDRTVIITDGAYLKLGGSNFSMDNAYDAIKLLCVGSDVCIDIGRFSNGD